MDIPDVKLDELEKKIEKLQKSIDKLLRIFFWTLIISVVLFVLPLIGLLAILPKFISNYTTPLNF